MRLASDFSYFGRKPAALHVCKRSAGRRGLEPGEGAGVWGEEAAEEGFVRTGVGVR